ncbi:major capsid protein [Lentilactobacillus buchneri]|uniref:major capsid protein n=1 Tax=Lentilactobacillus buchneri TaxID=1581 RepID=UPI0021A5E7E9|nr:major capsid protein [Lentilactobacillus buchneri]MCT2881928.1 major capsid protein E [Lentilactobacillus buchneri]
MSTLFDDINATNIGSFWTTLSANNEPYLWETLMPIRKQLASDFSFYKGTSNAPKPLKPSAFDAQAIMRERQGFQKLTEHTRYFKEGKYVDEALRQQLVRLGANGTPEEKDIINNHIFNDGAQLVTAAHLTQEILRNQIIQTGKVNVYGNGQVINDIDYGMKATHKVVTKKAWGSDGATPFDDIDQARQVVGEDSDQVITRAVMNLQTMRTLLQDKNVKGSMLYDNGQLANVTIPQSELLQFLAANYNLNVQVYDKRYVDIDGTTKKWIPDGRVIFLPDGQLGETIMSTTPEETDLLGSQAADVAVVDGGIAISTMTTADPVNKKVNVSQEVMPAFPQIDGIYILDTAATQAPEPTNLQVTPTADGANVSADAAKK